MLTETLTSKCASSEYHIICFIFSFIFFLKGGQSVSWRGAGEALFHPRFIF